LSYYNSATDVGGLNSARGTMNTYYQVGLLAAGVSLVAVVSPSFLSPDVSSQENQIRNIDSQITLLGDSK